MELLTPNAQLASAQLALDDAWPTTLGLPVIADATWGAALRYFAPRRTVEAFSAAFDLPAFTLYGSGDFHHLTALLVRRAAERHPGAPLHVISFDNHPDWDIRPPRWACGAWVNRALEIPTVASVAVWGCGNFELNFPARLFRSRRALGAHRLLVFAWQHRIAPGAARLFGSIATDTWRERFSHFAATQRGAQLYVTIDMDCLQPADAVTNWENGCFSVADIAWALRELRSACTLVGGDICGAFSPPRYARLFQRLAARWDHPRLGPIDGVAAAQTNLRTLQILWPVLTGTHLGAGAVSAGHAPRATAT